VLTQYVNLSYVEFSSFRKNDKIKNKTLQAGLESAVFICDFRRIKSILAILKNLYQ